MAHYIRDQRNIKALAYSSMSFNSKVNYSNHEKEILLRLVEGNKDVIESKRNDAPIIELKRNCWVNITRKFNTNHGVSARTTMQLKALWKNLKAKAKRDVWRVRSEINNSVINETNIDPETTNPLNMPSLSQRVCDILMQPAKEYNFNYDSNQFNGNTAEDDKSGIVVDYSQSSLNTNLDHANNGLEEVGLEFFDDQGLDENHEKTIEADKQLANGKDTPIHNNVKSIVIKDEPIDKDDDSMIIEDCSNSTKQNPTPPLMIQPLPLLTKHSAVKTNSKQPVMRHSPSYIERSNTSSCANTPPLSTSNYVYSDLHINHVESLAQCSPPNAYSYTKQQHHQSRSVNKNTINSLLNDGKIVTDRNSSPSVNKNILKIDDYQEAKEVIKDRIYGPSIEERNYHSKMLEMAEAEHKQKLNNLKIKEQILLLQKRKLEAELMNFQMNVIDNTSVTKSSDVSIKTDTPAIKLSESTCSNVQVTDNNDKMLAGSNSQCIASNSCPTESSQNLNGQNSNVEMTHVDTPQGIISKTDSSTKTDQNSTEIMEHDDLSESKTCTSDKTEKNSVDNMDQNTQNAIQDSCEIKSDDVEHV